MEPKNIETFVSEKVRLGMKKSDITEQLTAVGWSEDEVGAVYAKALVQNGVPIPENGNRGSYTKKSSTVEVVINFFSFILLGVVISALGTLYFAIINDFFPDKLNVGYSSYYYRRIADTIHYAIAALIIGYPMYYFAIRLWFKNFRQDETKVESKLTKWITYLVLLVSSITIVGDLIYIVYTFLQGEISIRFFLKALTVLVIAGMVFGFYYLERKKIQYKQDIPRSTFNTFGYILTGFVLVGIVLGFVVAGSPATERKRGFDEMRSENLKTLAGCITNYANQFYRLPSSLGELEKTSMSRCGTLTDPETGSMYEYSVTSPLVQKGTLFEGEFELCATFSLQRSDADDVSGYYYDNSKWYKHTAGRSCDIEQVSVKQPVTQVTQPQVAPLPVIKQ